MQQRTLDEQIAAAVTAAMKAQATANTAGNGTRKPPAPPALEPTTDTDPSWCPKHQVTMRSHEGNARGPGWFSHKLADGSYCKGK